MISSLLFDVFRQRHESYWALCAQLYEAERDVIRGKPGERKYSYPSSCNHVSSAEQMKYATVVFRKQQSIPAVLYAL